MEEKDYLSMITLLDFMLFDLGLYLDTHPTDEKALSLYRRIYEENSSLKSEYEKACGALCSLGPNPSPDRWTWINEPYPWQKEFGVTV